MDSIYTIYHGSCINAMEAMESKSVDLILTDPPYNLGKFMKNRATNLKQMRSNYFGAAGWDDLDYTTWMQSMDEFFERASRVIRHGGSMVVFMAIIKVETIIQLATKHGFYYKTTGIWHKTNPMPRNMNLHFINSTEAWIYFTYGTRTGTFNNNGKALHDFFETSVTPAGERTYGKHPTQKPIALLSEMVRILSNEGDVVYDPFMGSGSTGVASIINKRKFIGSEVNEEYCEISRSRMEKCQL
jgi:DNA modification methylase